MTLEIDRISKRFGTKTALDGVSFTAAPGELFGFVGSNGAGKTTTMRIALGVLAADSGEVRFAGRPVTHDTRAQIGYMPEERGLYPKMKVIDQLVYLAELHGLSTNDAHRAAELWIARLGLGPRRKDDIQKLSLGNQQRVQLAAALVHDPALLVLDEPFSGLDPLAVDVLSGVLREKAATGVPVVFSSHQLDLVERLCDRVGIIRDGRLAAVEEIADLKGKALKMIEVRMASPVPARALEHVPGVREVVAFGDRLRITLAGPIDPVVKALARYEVLDLQSREPSLEEIFLTFYGEHGPR